MQAALFYCCAACNQLVQSGSAKRAAVGGVRRIQLLCMSGGCVAAPLGLCGAVHARRHPLTRRQITHASAWRAAGAYVLVEQHVAGRGSRRPLSAGAVHLEEHERYPRYGGRHGGRATPAAHTHDSRRLCARRDAAVWAAALPCAPALLWFHGEWRRESSSERACGCRRLPGTYAGPRAPLPHGWAAPPTSPWPRTTSPWFCPAHTSRAAVAGTCLNVAELSLRASRATSVPQRLAV